MDGKVVSKPSEDVSIDADIKILSALKYVSKGGLKLEKALDYYRVDVTNHIAIDIGASTGGFTDCLIKRGIKEVYSIDTGTNQLHESLRVNPKVHSFENTNFLSFDLNLLPKIDLIVIDVSFTIVEPIFDRIIKNFKDVKVISLIKPQFELVKIYLKNGVVKNKRLHEEVLSNISRYLKKNGINPKEVIDSPILGGSGNKEFLIYFEI